MHNAKTDIIFKPPSAKCVHCCRVVCLHADLISCSFRAARISLVIFALTNNHEATIKYVRFSNVLGCCASNILPPGKYLSENMHDFCCTSYASADNHRKSVLASIHRNNSLEQFADFSWQHQHSSKPRRVFFH